MLPKPTFLHSRADFERTIKLGETIESIVLDFKKTLDPRTPGWQMELCRDVAQFANTRGGCLLLGVSERFDAVRSVKVADDAVGVGDADKVREYVETAIQNHLVPSSLTHEVNPIPLARATVVAVNIEPSRGLVYVWDRGGGTIECLRRTNHGKTPMNPDEMERHMMTGSRAAMLGFRDARLKATEPNKLEILGGVWSYVSGTELNKDQYSFECRLLSEDDASFAVTGPIINAPLPNLRTLVVPFDLLRSAWATAAGTVALLLSARIILDGDRNLTLEPL